MAIADDTAVAPVPPPTTLVEESLGPTRYLFSVEDYCRLEQVGILKDFERTELVEGVVVEMNPIGLRHSACVDAIGRLFAKKLLEVAHIRTQGPIVIDEKTQVQPDVSLVKLADHDYFERQPLPADVLLAVEVAESSLEYDLNYKMPIYATAGIQELWIVNLRNDTIEVRRKPNGNRYEELQTLRRGEVLRCLAFPLVEFDVGLILRKA